MIVLSLSMQERAKFWNYILEVNIHKPNAVFLDNCLGIVFDEVISRRLTSFYLLHFQSKIPNQTL